jgi:hypothetical protein
LSLFLREFFAEVVVPSTSISKKSELALESHSASAEEAGQRRI